jgi:tetratricopeptide (TPR) repeat protein
MACGESKDTLKQRYLAQGTEMAKIRNHEEAEHFFKGAIELDSCFADAWNNLGTLYFSQQRYEPAIEQYTHAIACKPDYWDAWLNRANAKYEAHEYYSALEDLKKLEKHKPDTAALYFMEGVVYTRLWQQRLGKLDNALVAFRQARKLDRANIEIAINEGTVFFYMKQYDSARAVLQKVLASNPREANALNVLAMIEIDQKNYTAAQEWLARALALEPNNAYFLNNRGYVYLLTGHTDQALADIDRSISTDPYNGWAYRNKGIYYIGIKRYADALRVLKQAEKLDPYIDNLYSYLSEAYFQNKDIKLACEAYRKSQERGDVVVGMAKKPCE